MPRTHKKRRKPFIRHGYYWGPGWSAGKAQDSVNYKDLKDPPEPMDIDDYHAREHDAAYADEMKRLRKRKLPFADEELRKADFKFAKHEWESGTVLGKIGAIGVGLQGAARGIAGLFTKSKFKSAPTDTPITNQNQSIMSASYYGKFAYPSKKPNKKANINGVTSFKEYNGSVKGVHTIALGVGSCPKSDPATEATVPLANSQNVDSPWTMISMAILKKIVRKHYQVDIGDYFQDWGTLFPPIYVANGTASTLPRVSKIVFYYKKINDYNANTLAPAFEITPSTTVSIATLACALGNSLKDFFSSRYELGTGGLAQNESYKHGTTLYGYSLVTQTNINPVEVRESTQIFPMENWIMKLNYHTTVRIQNVSQGHAWNADGTANNALDNSGFGNPIVGKLLHFKDPYPKVKDVLKYINFSTSSDYITPNTATTASTGAQWYPFLQDKDQNGIISSNASNNDAFYLRHMLRPELFTNCSSYSNISLNPGEIKSINFHFKFNGYINKLLEGLAVDIQVTGASPNFIKTTQLPFDSLGFGTMNLFTFEDFLGGGLGGESFNAPIAISFDIKRRTFCTVVKDVRRGTLPVVSYAEPVSTVPLDVMTS